jgi:hypothetical protein
MRHLLTAAAIIAGLTLNVAAACVTTGHDDAAMDKVESSWPAADNADRDGSYASALAKLNATYVYVADIRTPKLRACVANATQGRIVSARAGAVYLAHHPGDRPGAKHAAALAWKAFPFMTTCP